MRSRTITVTLRTLLYPLALLSAQCVSMGTETSDGGGAGEVDGGADPDGGAHDPDGPGASDGATTTDGGPFVPVTCEAQAGPDCASAAHELPIPTHFSQGAASFQFMATDQPDMHLASPIPPTYVPGECYPVYNYGIMPQVDHYPAADYSTRRVSDADARDWAESICAETGVQIQHLHPPAAGAGPSSDRCRVQIIHAALADGSLFTVFLPPSWSEHAPSGTYPIVANGFYDIHENTFGQYGTYLARHVARSGLDGRRGVIGVLWNGGGALASRTMNPHAHDQFAEVIDQVVERYRGNRRWVVLFGGSRGGYTALAMSSNPKGHDYRTVLTIAMAPPTRVGEHARLASTTFPNLLHAAGWTVGLADAWRSDFLYPACAGIGALTGLNRWQAALAIMAGNADAEVVDSELSPLSPAFLDGLVAAGTQLYLEGTEHDHIIPYSHQVQYGRAVLARGIPAQMAVLIRAGHAHLELAGSSVPAYQSFLASAVAILSAPSLDLAGPVPSLVEPGISFYRVNRGTQQLEPFTLTDGAYPFSVDIPYVAWVGGTYPIVFVGEPGTEYRLEVGLGGTPALTLEGTLEDPTKVEWVPVPLELQQGIYSWTLEIRKPGQVWVEIPLTNTPTGQPCTTHVSGEEPGVDHASAAAAAHAPSLAGFPNTNWGLSEY